MGYLTHYFLESEHIYDLNWKGALSLIFMGVLEIRRSYSPAQYYFRSKRYGSKWGL